MPHSISIPHAMRCHSSGAVVVGAASVGLPAGAWENTKGKDIEVLLGIETDQIRMELDGSDAGSADMLWEAGDKLTVPGIDAIKKLRMIRVTTDATVTYWAFSRPI